MQFSQLEEIAKNDENKNSKNTDQGLIQSQDKEENASLKFYSRSIDEDDDCVNMGDEDQMEVSSDIDRVNMSIDSNELIGNVKN